MTHDCYQFDMSVKNGYIKQDIDGYSIRGTKEYFKSIEFCPHCGVKL